MGQHLSPADLADLARRELRRGRRMWAEHQPAAEGTCTECGRIYPCHTALIGAWLIVYWGRTER